MSILDLSTTTYVYGIRPPDEKWQRMAAAYRACEAAGVAVPEVVDRFFGGESPDPKGVLVDLAQQGAAAVWRPGDGSLQEGVEVSLSQLPDGVQVIRFVNSY